MQKIFSLLLLVCILSTTTFAQSSSEGPLEAAFEFETNCLSVICNNTSQGHLTSQWVFNNTDTLFTEDASFQFSESGTYNVALTVVSGTGATATTQKDITVSNCGNVSTSIEDEAPIPTIKTYPNPATAVIHFDFGTRLSNYQLHIYNVIGQEMDNLIIDQEEISIHLQDYHNGAYVYILRDQTGATINSGRFLVHQ